LEGSREEKIVTEKLTVKTSIKKTEKLNVKKRAKKARPAPIFSKNPTRSKK